MTDRRLKHKLSEEYVKNICKHCSNSANEQLQDEPNKVLYLSQI